ncbi:MAG TPA: lysophospholipid acyltransferase family protein [Microlunatus sp.]|nr:lysophospholipid acyltransferase family protein [Microlunatus sp.]
MGDPSRTHETVLRPLSQANHEPVEPAYRAAVLVVHTVIRGLIRRDWRAQDKLPQSGGLVVVANHISNVDPIAVAQYLAFSGRWGRFLAKDSLFGVPVIGRLLSACGQIPVQRNTRSAADALSAAIEAVRQGKCVVVYPEGTITTDPDLWPMEGKTGAARIAYATGCPIIPVAQWGAQDIMYGKRIEFPRLLPRKTFRLIAGDPVPLEPGGGDAVTSAMLVRTTRRIMDTLTELTSQLRHEPPPDRSDGVDAADAGGTA